MEIKLTNASFLHRKKPIKFIMRTFIFLCCTTVFGFSPSNIVSQNSKVNIEESQLLTVDEVFDLVMAQTDYKFFYEEGLFNDFSKVRVKKGKISTNELLERSLSQGNLDVKMTDNNAILISIKDTEVIVEKPQTQVVSGNVTDSDGIPLPGASILEKGTTNGTQSDFDGNFSLDLTDSNATLVVSYIGYSSQEISAVGQEKIKIALLIDAASLDEVVVIGYGTALRKDVTGSTGSVKAEIIEQQPVVRLEDALQGTVAGVAVTSQNGQPGQAMNVKIRGTSSITGGTGPLYVVDGFVGANTQGINPNDIQSIEVLKDASATAIYGSRGSNGVVIITTKSGKSGKLKVDFGAWASIGSFNNNIDLLNAADFATVVNYTDQTTGAPETFSTEQIEGFRENGGTDWQQELQRTAIVQNYDLGISGGGENIKYRFSINHLDEPGTLINQKYKRTTFRSNLDFKISEKLSLKVNLTGFESYGRNNRRGGDLGEPFAQANIWAPTEPVFNEDGGYNIKAAVGSIGMNPIAEQSNRQIDLREKSFAGTTILTWEITDALSFTSTNAYSTFSNVDSEFRGVDTERGFIQGSANANHESISGYSFLNSNYFVYKKVFGEHSFAATALYEQQVDEVFRFQANADALSTEALGYYNLGLGGTQTVNSSYEDSSIQSYMGRINYGFKDKYLFTASYRYDGSSRLIEKYQGFPSMAVAWRISNENFLKDSEVVSELKLRASYGETGNQAVDPYSSIARIGTGVPYFYDGTTPSISTPLGAPAPQDLKWEVAKQTDIGVDASLYNGRLRLSADWYNKDVTDLLYSQTAPLYFGGQDYDTNLGELNNSGFEFSIGGTPINKGDFKWNSSFNISFNTNEVIDLGGLDDIPAGTGVGNVSFLKVGQPLGEIIGYEFLGTWKTSEAAEAATYGMIPGDAKFTDVNNDLVYNTEDLVTLGNGNPDFSWGFINDFRYKNWSASIFFQGVSGNDVYSRTLAYTWGGQGQAQHPTNADAVNLWTPANETENPKYTSTGKNFLNSSRYVYDATYFRLKNLLIAYKLPIEILSKTAFTNVEIYGSGQNLFTVTDFPGYDPEVTSSNSPITLGTEWASIPNQTTYTLGVRVGF